MTAEVTVFWSLPPSINLPVLDLSINELFIMYYVGFNQRSRIRVLAELFLVPAGPRSPFPSCWLEATLIFQRHLHSSPCGTLLFKSFMHLYSFHFSCHQPEKTTGFHSNVDWVAPTQIISTSEGREKHFLHYICNIFSRGYPE